MRDATKLIVGVFQEFYSIVYLNSGLSFKKKKEYYSYAIIFKKVKRFKW